MEAARTRALTWCIGCRAARSCVLARRACLLGDRGVLPLGSWLLTVQAIFPLSGSHGAAAGALTHSCLLLLHCSRGVRRAGKGAL